MDSLIKTNKQTSISKASTEIVLMLEEKFNGCLEKITKPEYKRELEMSQTFRTACMNYITVEHLYKKMLFAASSEVLSLVRLFKVNNMLDEQEVTEWVHDTIQNYRDICLEDFVFLCKTVKLGKIETRYEGTKRYEKVYNRLDISVLNDWFMCYYEAKIQERDYMIERRREDIYNKPNQSENENLSRLMREFVGMTKQRKVEVELDDSILDELNKMRENVEKVRLDDITDREN